MSDRDALLAAILANPDEDTPRLMFADWLDEHGDPARAEFIRVQIELARLRAAEADLPTSFDCGISSGGVSYRPHDTEEHIQLLTHEAELLRDHREQWQGGLPPYAVNRDTKRLLAFRRGFVGFVGASLDPFTKNPASLWKHHPVEAITFQGGGEGARKKFSACKPLEAVREMYISPVRAEVEMIAQCANCPYLSRLRQFSLGRITNTDAATLAASQHLRPTALQFVSDGLHRDGLTAMLNSPFASRLRGLDPCCRADWGIEVIAEAPLVELRQLNLTFEPVGDAGLAALACSQHLKQLITLGLNNTGVTDNGLELLASSAVPNTVRSLDLQQNRMVTSWGVEALVRAPEFRPVHLSLRSTATGDEGAKAIASWPELAGLVILDLSYANIGDTGVLALADSPHWRDIRDLRLNGGSISRGAANRIRERVGEQNIGPL